jgi:membrane associated rhomboid family serine protease
VSLTNLLVLVNVVVYLWEVAVGGGRDFATALIDGPTRIAGALYGVLVLERGEWWRIFTAAFLHASIWHVGLNMIALYQVGNIVERLYGKLRFALLYVVSIVGSGLAVVYTAPNQPTVGASGAIFGLFGALVAVGLRLGRPGRELIRQVVPIIVLNLVFTFTVPGISAAAHVGGLVTGFLAGLLLFMAARHRELMTPYAYAYSGGDPEGVETIEQPPDAGPHEEENAPPLEVRDPRE